MQEGADLIVARAAVAAVRDRFHTASDDELLADGFLIEEIGNMLDSLRAGFAAQVESRSRKTLGEESLAFRHGARDGGDLVQLITRVSAPEAKRRVGIGTALAPRTSLTGELLPGRLSALSAAVTSGAVGVDAARVIVNLWKSVHLRADADRLDDAVECLIRTAQTTDEEGLREVAHYWDLALDPDGVGGESRQRKQRRKRALKIGRTLDDGTTRVSLVMTPEDLAVLKELLQSKRRGKKLIRTEAGSDETDDSLGPEWREDPAESPQGVPSAWGVGVDPERDDPRMRSQQDYDTLIATIGLAARAEQEGIGGLAVTHQVVVTVTAGEVENRKGLGWAPGIMAALPMPVIERIACDGETRLQVIGPRGEALHLSRAHRLFSAAQKLALVVASGGRCQYPGCRVPHPYLEAHHAKWFERDQGETRIENGILLCSYHHHLVHAKDSPIEIRTHDGDLFIVPRGWRGPPDPLHRRQSATSGDPRFRRTEQPDRSETDELDCDLWGRRRR